MNKSRFVVSVMLSLLLMSCHTLPDNGATEYSTTHQHQMLVSGIKSDYSASEFSSHCEGVLENAKKQFIVLENDPTEATLQSVFAPYDAMLIDLQSIQQSWYLKAVHPDAALRQAAADCTIQYSDFFSYVSMSRKYFDRVSAIKLDSLTPSEKYMVQNSLVGFKQSGVDKDDETRAKIRQLRQDISEVGNQFSRNIQEDVRFVETTVKDLDGLPQDYIDNHLPDENGVVRLSTDYPDIGPVMTYSPNDELKRQLRVASRSRGYPINEPVLKTLISKRYELAQLLGYENWAALSMSNKMIGTPKYAQEFLNEVGAAVKEPLAREKAMFLERLQEIDPNAKEVNAWQAGYISNLLRKERYALDSKEVREYFDYNNVRDGIFKLTEDLFDVRIKPWETQTWHEDVESFEIWDGKSLIGRFYMDNHPRKDKYKHAAAWTLRSGLLNKQIPLSGLAQNFPKGLMEHGQVNTFLHEFGHLLHNMFSGNQKWLSIAGMSMELDFVEAPSQMLEEWIWDYDTLKRFARNKAGETIPKSLVEKMNRARNFGYASRTAGQVYYANLSLNYYSRDPEQFELMSLMKALSDQFNPYPHVEGTAFFANFGHLNGYSSDYYIYQWSLAIATDLFSKFKENGIRNKSVAKRYRQLVLGAAGSKPAKEFVADFLGREFTPNTYIEKIKSQQ